MQNIKKSLLQFIFGGCYMKRWNDKLRPMEFIEADKQAHKMIVAWILCRLNAPALPRPEDRLELELHVIERAMFDYFLRLVITDIKPPVYYRIRKNEDDYLRLAEWVISELEPHLSGLDAGFWKRLTSYVLKPDADDLASRILNAAHNYASNWELSILKSMNEFDPELPEIIDDFKKKLDANSDLAGMEQLLSNRPNALGSFARLCGQLRFQKRWSQTPRIPETSVMGHMFIVSCYAYFFSLSLGAGRARRVNNFFCALFHDLPELLTRDIISPVKKSADSLNELIKNYENEELERRVFAPLRLDHYTPLVERLSYYLGMEIGSEFQDCVHENGKVRAITFQELQNGGLDRDDLDPKDGRMLKTCDNLAAFIEAYTATRNGIQSDHLYQAIWRIKSENAKLVLGNIHVGALLADFD